MCEAGIGFTLWAHDFNPGFLYGLCCSVISFMCIILLLLFFSLFVATTLSSYCVFVGLFYCPPYHFKWKYDSQYILLGENSIWSNQLLLIKIKLHIYGCTLTGNLNPGIILLFLTVTSSLKHNFSYHITVKAEIFIGVLIWFIMWIYVIHQIKMVLIKPQLNCIICN